MSSNGSDREFVIRMAERLIPIKSISTETGGEGEGARAAEICRILEEHGYKDHKTFSYKDKAGVDRPSVVLKIGNYDRTLWLISHIDTVPAGSEELWSRPPFSVTVEGDKMYGRGTADNGEGIFSTLLLLNRLKKEKMRFNLGLAFVADEEVGSKYGIEPLIHENIFAKDDLIIVPDSGTPEGLDIEIAEKTTMWIKFTVTGKQGHASLPKIAVNATEAAMKFAVSMNEALRKNFDATDGMFDDPDSTFELTKIEKNVDNVNTIPGLVTFYMDSRVLPKYDPSLMLDFVKNQISEFEKSSQAKIAMEVLNNEHTPPTSTDSEIYKELSSAVESVVGKKARPIGIGGGTCAAFFRNIGMGAVVWGISDPDVYHKPDEYVSIANLIKATEVYEKILYKD